MLNNWIVVMGGKEPLITTQCETVSAVVALATEWLGYDDDEIVVAIASSALAALVAALGAEIAKAEDVRDVRRLALAILTLTSHEGWISEWTDERDGADPVCLFSGYCTSSEYDVQCRIEGALMSTFNLTY